MKAAGEDVIRWMVGRQWMGFSPDGPCVGEEVVSEDILVSFEVLCGEAMLAL
jgi:hypothetical protein